MTNKWVTFISPDSEHFDPSSLNISCHKEVVEPFVWDNSTKSYVGKIRCYFGDDIVNFTIGTPDNRIVCELEGFIENLESITEANFKVDFSQYHYVPNKKQKIRECLFMLIIFILRKTIAGHHSLEEVIFILIWLIMQHGVNPGNIPMNLRLHLMMLP